MVGGQRSVWTCAFFFFFLIIVIGGFSHSLDTLCFSQVKLQTKGTQLQVRGSMNNFFHIGQNKWFLGNQGWALYGMHIRKDSSCFWVPAWGSDMLLPYACDCPSAWWRFSLIYSKVIVLRLDIRTFHNYSACCRLLKCWEFSANALCSSKNAWSILHFVKEREKKKPNKMPRESKQKSVL